MADEIAVTKKPWAKITKVDLYRKLVQSEREVEGLQVLIHACKEETQKLKAVLSNEKIKAKPLKDGIRKVVEGIELSAAISDPLFYDALKAYNPYDLESEKTVSQMANHSHDLLFYFYRQLKQSIM